MPRRRRHGPLGILLALFACGLIEGELQAQQGAAGALHQLFVGGDAQTAVLSAAQLDVLKKALAVYVNSLPTPGSPLFVNTSSSALSAAPVYLERALTVARRRFDVFALYQHASWGRIDRIDLEGGDLVNRIPSFFGRPAIESRVAMSLSSDTAAVGLNYGVGQLVDVGITVPIQRVCADGARTVRVDPGDVQRIAAHGCSAGIGDVLLRGKLTSNTRNGVAVGAQALVSLATGAPSRLTGKGDGQVTLTGIASKTTGPIQPHLNLGATLGGDGVAFSTVDFFGTSAFQIERISASNSFNYAAGTTFVVSPALSLKAEYLGRALRHAARFAAVETLGGAALETLPVGWQSAGILSAGATLRMRNRYIISAHGARQLSRSGLRMSWLAGVSVTVQQGR